MGKESSIPGIFQALAAISEFGGGGFLVDRIQVARASRSRQRKGDEGPTNREGDGEDNGSEIGALEFRRMVYGGFKILVDA
jgi:hypothetical protein